MVMLWVAAFGRGWAAGQCAFLSTRGRGGCRRKLGD